MKRKNGLILIGLILLLNGCAITTKSPPKQIAFQPEPIVKIQPLELTNTQLKNELIGSTITYSVGKTWNISKENITEFKILEYKVNRGISEKYKIKLKLENKEKIVESQIYIYYYLDASINKWIREDIRLEDGKFRVTIL